MNWLRCIAAVNLCLIRFWVELFAYTPWPAHRNFNPPQSFDFLSTAILCLLLGTVLYGIVLKTSLLARMTAVAVLLVLLLKEAFLAASNLRWFYRGDWIGSFKWMAIAAVLFSLTILAARFGMHNEARMNRLTRTIAGALLPFAALTLGQAFWNSVFLIDKSVASSALQPRASAAVAGKRVVWILFDELDERIAFSQRPAGFRLPALDQFRTEANFVATHASSPYNATVNSIPALLSANLLAKENRLEDTILHRLTARGIQTAVVGWAIPYCPELGANVADCVWQPIAQQHNSYGSGLSLLNRARSLFESNHLSPFGQSLAVQHHVEQVEDLTRAAIKAAARPDLQFVFLHLPHAHNPFVWDPETQRPILAPHPRDPRGYLRNLHWADAAFARIRLAMENAGIWERSVVLVSADHGFRDADALGYSKDDLHVPFLLKSPSGGVDDLDPQAPFETIQSADLLLKLMLRH